VVNSSSQECKDEIRGLSGKRSLSVAKSHQDLEKNNNEAKDWTHAGKTTYRRVNRDYPR